MSTMDVPSGSPGVERRQLQQKDRLGSCWGCMGHKGRRTCVSVQLRREGRAGASKQTSDEHGGGYVYEVCIRWYCLRFKASRVCDDQICQLVEDKTDVKGQQDFLHVRPRLASRHAQPRTARYNYYNILSNPHPPRFVIPRIPIRNHYQTRPHSPQPGDMRSTTSSDHEYRNTQFVCA